MGMFDDINCGARTGQVKCWGRTLSTYTIGDHVTLHTPTRRTDSHSGWDQDGTWVFSYDGHPRDDIGDYQILCADRSALIVNNGIWVQWADQVDATLPIYDNYGEPVEHDNSDEAAASRGAWVDTDDVP